MRICNDSRTIWVLFRKRHTQKFKVFWWRNDLFTFLVWTRKDSYMGHNMVQLIGHVTYLRGATCHPLSKYHFLDLRAPSFFLLVQVSPNRCRVLFILQFEFITTVLFADLWSIDFPDVEFIQAIFNTGGGLLMAWIVDNRVSGRH